MNIRAAVLRLVLCASFVLLLGCQPTPAPGPPVINPQPPTTPTPPAVSAKEPPKPAQSPPLEAAWKIYKDKDEGFEIAYSPLWLAFTKEQITKAAAKVGGGKLFLFYAIDAVSGIISKPEFLEYPGSFSITKISMSKDVTLTLLEKEAVNDIESDQNTIKPVSAERINLLPGEAIKLRYSAKLPNRPGNVVFIHYLFIKGSSYYICTTETETAMIEKYEPLYEKMAKSFRFTE